MTMKYDMPRGLRNNNPGNIRRGPSRWKGMKAFQRDPKFVVFKEIRWGYRAIMKLLMNYRFYYSLFTIEKLIHRWAPPIENDTARYVALVCAETNMPPTYEFDPFDREDMCRIAAAISFVENGVRADMNEVYAGWELVISEEDAR